MSLLNEDLRGAMCARPETGLPADAWFAFHDDPLYEAAKEVCASCPVRATCLEVALAGNEQYGIWGGLDERERAVVARGRMRERRRLMEFRQTRRTVR